MEWCYFTIFFQISDLKSHIKYFLCAYYEAHVFYFAMHITVVGLFKALYFLKNNLSKTDDIHHKTALLSYGLGRPAVPPVTVLLTY